MIRLASTSATRASLLRTAGIDFIQESVEFDEDSIALTNPKSYIYAVAMGKFEANFSHFGCDDYPLLVADTVVSVGDLILKKATCRDDAKRLLKLQSGSEVTIMSAMIYISTKLKLIDISSTNYKFRAFDNKRMIKYLDSNEWQNKAGACMVEGFCMEFIESVRGNESTAMGLNTEILRRFI